jgi:hypothetical protein
VIDDAGARWALSVIFAVVGLCYLAAAARSLRTVRADGIRSAVGALLHVAMSAAMIAMAWPGANGLPAMASVTTFTAGAGWFAGRATFGSSGVPVNGGARSGNWFHAALMAVMVWMAVAASLMSGAAGGSGAVASPVGLDMAGMTMSGIPTSAAAGLGGTPAATAALGAPAGGAARWAGAVCLVLAVALLAAAVALAIAALRPLAAGPLAAGPLAAPGHGPRGSLAGKVAVAARDGAGALMAAGMAVALLLMA